MILVVSKIDISNPQPTWQPKAHSSEKAKPSAQNHPHQLPNDPLQMGIGSFVFVISVNDSWSVLVPN